MGGGTRERACRALGIYLLVVAVVSASAWMALRVGHRVDLAVRLPLASGRTLQIRAWSVLRLGERSDAALDAVWIDVWQGTGRQPTRFLGAVKLPFWPLGMIAGGATLLLLGVDYGRRQARAGAACRGQGGEHQHRPDRTACRSRLAP